jgi:hypothetical protein
MFYCQSIAGAPELCVSLFPITFIPRFHLKWDEEFRNRADPSGRAMKSVHSAAYEDGWEAAGEQKHVNDMNGTNKRLKSG